MSRQSDRRDRDPDVRIFLLEEDMDRVDQRFEETIGKIEHKANNADMAARGLSLRVDKLTDKFEAFEEKVEEKVDGNRRVMVGVLISTLSVAIAIVAQVLVMRGGS